MKSLIGMSISAVAMMVLIASPLAFGQDPNVIKIVSSLPRTGSTNYQSTTIVNGIRMAIDEAGNKVGAFTIKYEDWDDASPERGQWDPAVEAANAQRAVGDPDVMVYIGTYNSGAVKISMPKLNQAGLVIVSPANTWPGLTKPGVGEPNEPMVYRPTGKITFVRVVPADDIQGSVGAKWASELGCKKVFILHDRELYGKGIADIFRKTAPKDGLQIMGFEGIDAKSSNYKALVTKIRQTGADIVYFGGTTQSNAGQIVKDLRAGGLTDIKFMGPDACFEKAFIEAAGHENLDGRTFVTFGGVPAKLLTGKGHEFYENYKKRYDAEPEGYAAYGYESASVALDAIRRAGVKDRAAICDAVIATKDFDGVLGKWSFDANGDTTLTTMSGNAVKNGDFEFVKLLSQEFSNADASSDKSASMSNMQVFLQQIITGLSNGMIIALIAIGYTMVYGIIELINFAHGDLFMLGAFLALTLAGALGFDTSQVSSGFSWGVVPLFVVVPIFCAGINWTVDRLAYRPLRTAPRLAPLVSAIGVSFIFLNLGLFWGGVPMHVFNMGISAAAPKDFPPLVANQNLLGAGVVQYTLKDLMVLVITIPLMAALTLVIKFTRMGKAMRAVAQDQTAARLMGINADQVIGLTFIIGGALGGVASVVYALYNNTIYFQMGFRVGIDAFTAAVLGGIGNLPGAVLGGIVIGLIRSMSDQYIATRWTNVMVFSILILVLIFRPSGLLGSHTKEKV